MYKRMTNTVLLKLAARAQGGLEILTLRNYRFFDYEVHDTLVEECEYLRQMMAELRGRANDPVVFSSLLDIVRANATELYFIDIAQLFEHKFMLPRLEAILTAAPDLSLLTVSLKLTGAEATRVRSEAMFHKLRFYKLSLVATDWPDDQESTAEATAFLAHLSAIEDLGDGHSFETLRLEHVSLENAPALDALCAFVASVGGIEG